MGGFKFVVLVALVSLVAYWLLTDHQPASVEDLLRGKRVVVTGASSGIGEQAALFYAKQGASVLVVARRENLLKEVVKQLHKVSPLPQGVAKFHYLVADFAQVENSEGVMLEAIRVLGGLDILMLNHAFLLGINHSAGRWTGNTDQQVLLGKSLDVNFLSFVRMAGVALPTLKAGNGSICVISSMAVEVPKHLIPYAASKSAMNTFFTGLRQELIHEQHNVSVTLVHLGLIYTDNTDEAMKNIARARGSDRLDATVESLPKTSPAQAGADIAIVTARREADVYYPYNHYLWVYRLLRLLTTRGDEYLFRLENYMNGY